LSFANEKPTADVYMLHRIDLCYNGWIWEAHIKTDGLGIGRYKGTESQADRHWKAERNILQQMGLMLQRMDFMLQRMDACIYIYTHMYTYMYIYINIYIYLMTDVEKMFGHMYIYI
jgi:hypothetical protein